MFTWQKAIRDDRSLTSTQRLVALTVSLHMDAKTGGSAFPGGALLRDETGLHIKTVYAALAELVDEGWLTLVREGKPPRAGEPRVASEYASSYPGPGVQDYRSPEPTGSPDGTDRESRIPRPGAQDSTIGSSTYTKINAGARRRNNQDSAVAFAVARVGLDEDSVRSELERCFPEHVDAGLAAWRLRAKVSA